MINELLAYLGKDVSKVLSSDFFKDRDFETETYEELNPPRVYYICDDLGVSMSTQGSSVVNTVFLDVDQVTRVCREENLDMLDARMAMGREELREHLGEPSRSGAQCYNEFLGEMGAYDRFDGPDGVMHFEYHLGGVSRIEKITLMRKETAP